VTTVSSGSRKKAATINKHSIAISVPMFIEINKIREGQKVFFFNRWKLISIFV